MGCLLAILAYISPRLVLLVLFIATQYAEKVWHEDWTWPIIGFIFMPYTTLAYMAAILNNSGRVDGGWLVLVIVAVLLDMGQGKIKFSSSDDE